MRLKEKLPSHWLLFEKMHCISISKCGSIYYFDIIIEVFQVSLLSTMSYYAIGRIVIICQCPTARNLPATSYFCVVKLIAVVSFDVISSWLFNLILTVEQLGI